MLRTILSFILGTLFTQTPVTAILLLGWLMSHMRHHALRTAGISVPRPRWFTGPATKKGKLWRTFGGIWTILRRGIGATLSIFVATFPFAVFWLVAWWAGWENSFNKGYEQAFVGPLVGLLGIAVFAAIMVHLPLAMVHQSVTDRAFSLFEIAKVRSALSHTGWGYVLWTAALLFFALPIFASRGLPVFGEGIIPGLADMSAGEVGQVKLAIKLFTGAYIFVVLVIMRRWSAIIFARAVARAAWGRDVEIWDGSLVRGKAPPTRANTPWRFTRTIRMCLLLALWAAFAVLIFVGQFLNHNWFVWLSHPFVFLPWVI